MENTYPAVSSFLPGDGNFGIIVLQDVWYFGRAVGLGKGDVEFQTMIPSHQAEPWRIYSSWKDELD